MKLIKLDDIMRAISKRSLAQSPRLSSITVSSLAGFDVVDIQPEFGFIAICGGTGVGKTALLETIFAGLAPISSLPEILKDERLAGATIKITISSADGKYTGDRLISVDHGGINIDGYPAGVKLIQLVERTSVPETYFIDKDITVLKEPISPSSFDETALSLVSMICKKEYASISVYEIEAEGDQIIPLFEVVESGKAYDNRSMATGELSALSLAWEFRSAPPNSIVLVEEPEAFLPPVGHVGVIGLIASFALKQNLCVVLTTHSSVIASKIPDAGLLSLRRRAGNSTVPKGLVPRIRVLSQLGLRPQTNAIIFVEDVLALRIARGILSRFEFNIACNIEVVNTNGGSGAVRKALAGLPGDISSVKCLGVLDGDEQDIAALWPEKDQILYLPFTAAIEVELLEGISQAAGRFSKTVSRTRTQIEDLLQETVGNDPHDRFDALRNSLGLTAELLTDTAFEHWILQPGHKKRLGRFVASLAESLEIALPTK